LISANQGVILCEWANKHKVFALLYRGSRDGTQTSNFHKKCSSNRGEAFVIIRTNKGEIFGAFTPALWTMMTQTEPITVPMDSFLFAMKDTAPITKFPASVNRVRNAPPPLLSSEHDILLTLGPDIKIASGYTKSFSANEFPIAYVDTTGKGYQNFTTGAVFVVDDVEVFGSSNAQLQTATSMYS